MRSLTQNPSISDDKTQYSKLQVLTQITAILSNNYIQFILFSRLFSSSLLRISVTVCYNYSGKIHATLSIQSYPPYHDGPPRNAERFWALSEVSDSQLPGNQSLEKQVLLGNKGKIQFVAKFA